LVEDHPSAIFTMVSLASLRENREASRRLSDEIRVEHGLREVLETLSIKLQDWLLQFAIARSLEDDNDGEERLRRSLEILQQSDDHDDSGIDEERLRLELAMSLEVDNDNDMLTREDDGEEEKMMNCLSIQREGKLWTLYMKEREGKPNADCQSRSPMPSTSAKPSSSPWGQARPTGASETDRGKRGRWGQARLVGAGETGGGRRGWWGQARPMGAVSRRAKSLVNMIQTNEDFVMCEVCHNNDTNE